MPGPAGLNPPSGLRAFVKGEGPLPRHLHTPHRDLGHTARQRVPVLHAQLLQRARRAKTLIGGWQERVAVTSAPWVETVAYDCVSLRNASFPGASG